MGLTHIAVKVISPNSEGTYTANFLVDTGAWDTLVPASELRKIGVEPTGKRSYELASGEVEEFETGFVQLSFMDEIVTARVIFGADEAEPLLGVKALELAEFTVDPVNRTIKKLNIFPLKRVA